MSACCETMRLALKGTFVQLSIRNEVIINLVPDYGGSMISYKEIQYCPWCGTSVKRLNIKD